MRIVFVVHTFFPNWRAGTEVYAKSLALKLIAQGHEAFVVCYEPPGEKDAFEEIRTWDDTYEGLPVHRISFCKKHTSFHLKDYFDQAMEDSLSRYFSLIRPDIVHVVHAMHLTTASIWAAKRLGLPVVGTATDFWYICPTYQLIKWDESLCTRPHPLTCLACVTGGAQGAVIRRIASHSQLARLLSPLLVHSGSARLFQRPWMASLLWLAQRRHWMRKTLANVDVLLAPTANTARLIQVNGIRSQTTVSGFGLETPLARAQEIGVRDSALRIGYVGTFRRSKGLHILLEAMRRLTDCNVSLAVYGSMGHVPEYDRLLQELAAGLVNVSFRGTFPNNDLSKVFAQFDVLVIPSLWYENSPLVLLSAFALGIPVVASNVGSLADLVEHGKNGLLFETANAQDLAHTLRSLVNEPEQLKRLRAGIPKIRTIDDNVGELLEVYERLIRESSSKQPSSARPVALPRSALRWASILRSLGTTCARFGDVIWLIRCEVHAPGHREIQFSFRWHTPEICSDWVVFIHLVDENGETQMQGDHPIALYDHDPWGFISYRRSIHAAQQHLGKRYRVRIGVWNPQLGTRLPVSRSRATEDGESAISLGSVRVE